MRKKLLIVSVCVVLVFGAANICAPKGQRFTFKRGAKPMVLNGKLSGYKGKKMFVIRLRRGQNPSAEQISSNGIVI